MIINAPAPPFHQAPHVVPEKADHAVPLDSNEAAHPPPLPPFHVNPFPPPPPPVPPDTFGVRDQDIDQLYLHMKVPPPQPPQPPPPPPPPVTLFVPAVPFVALKFATVPENITFPHTSRIRHPPPFHPAPPLHGWSDHPEPCHDAHPPPHAPGETMFIQPQLTTLLYEFSKIPTQAAHALPLLQNRPCHNTADHGILCMPQDPDTPFTIPFCQKDAAPPTPPCPHFPAKLNVVPVRSQFPCTCMCNIQPVGVIFTVFAPGANVVYCFLM